MRSKKFNAGTVQLIWRGEKSELTRQTRLRWRMGLLRVVWHGTDGVPWTSQPKREKLIRKEQKRQRLVMRWLSVNVGLLHQN